MTFQKIYRFIRYICIFSIDFMKENYSWVISPTLQRCSLFFFEKTEIKYCLVNSGLFAVLTVTELFLNVYWILG